MRRSGWLSSQPRAFQDQVLELTELRHFAAGATIYNIGDVALDIWGLVEGELSVFMAPEASAPFLVHVAKPGWWVGDTALISETPRRAELMTREESWLLRLSSQSIYQLAKTDPETWRRLALISIGHLDHALSIIAGLTDRDSPRAWPLRFDGLPALAIKILRVARHLTSPMQSLEKWCTSHAMLWLRSSRSLNPLV